MKKNLFAVFFALLFLACENDVVSSAGENGNTANNDNGFLQEKHFDDLPGCTKNREGYLAAVKDSAYLCKSRGWESLGLFYETEETMPSCSSKRNGYIVFALDTRTQYICSNKKWRTSLDSVYIVKVDTIVENESSPYYSSGTFCWSENCASASSSSVARSSGSKALSSASVVKSSSSLAVSSSSVVKSSSSKSLHNEAVLQTYDCSTYKCVTTKYLNQDMLAAGAYGEILDSRDGQVYRIVQIGTQVWMAQNLNYAADGSLCYERESANCENYGRLYYWSAISDREVENQGRLQGPCFDGWHVPTDDEFLELVDYVGNGIVVELGREFSEWPAYYSYGNSGAALKSANYEWTGGPYADIYGFSAVPSGTRWDYGSFDNLGSGAVYWTNSVANIYWGPRTLTRSIGKESYVGAHWDLLNYMFAIRCLMD
jgi:uncharacterized protein (TIGR02145 family)